MIRPVNQKTFGSAVEGFQLIRTLFIKHSVAKGTAKMVYVHTHNSREGTDFQFFGILRKNDYATACTNKAYCGGRSCCGNFFFFNDHLPHTFQYCRSPNPGLFYL